MRLEMVFKPEYSTKEAASVDYIELSKNGKEMALDWDESQKWVDEKGNHHLYAKGVYINEEYGDGKLSEIKGAEVSGIQLYNHETDTEESRCEILSLSIYDGERGYSFSKDSLRRILEQEEVER